MLPILAMMNYLMTSGYAKYFFQNYFNHCGYSITYCFDNLFHEDCY